MLTNTKKKKLALNIKNYSKKYINKRLATLDESSTRLMINSFLTDVLGYKAIEEIKTEYMIRGTYADYVIQIKGKQYFLIEVKASSLELSEKHLRQAVNYAANEGIDWIMLTNGRRFDFYRVLFNKPIESRLVFSIDIGDASKVKSTADALQYLHRASVLKKGLNILWNKHNALESSTIASMLCAAPVVKFVNRTLNKKFKHKFSQDDILGAIHRVIEDIVCMDGVKATVVHHKKKKNKVDFATPIATTQPIV